MCENVPLLIISGSMGVGKTTVLSEVSDLLIAADVPHGAIDLDWLGVMHSPQGDHGERLLFANLAAVWRQYRAAGARCLVVARVVEDRQELKHYQEAVPRAEVIVCRLTASTEAMRVRLSTREPGPFQPRALARSVELDGILTEAGAEDFEVDNDAGRSITEVAREVLVGAAWL